MSIEGMELWFPLSVSYPRNPKVWRGGFAASMVHLAVMMASKQFSKTGTGYLPAECWQAEYLHPFIGVWSERCTLEEFREAMPIAVREDVQLVELVEDAEGKRVMKPHDWEVYNDLARRSIYKQDRERRKQSTSKPPAEREQNASKTLADSTVQNRTEQGKGNARPRSIEQKQPAKRKQNASDSQAKQLVDLCCELWPHWPRMQVEQSVIMLVPAMHSAGIDPEVTIRAARQAHQPEPLDYQRAHSFINREIGIQVRDREKTAAPPPDPEKAKRRAAYLVKEQREAVLKGYARSVERDEEIERLSFFADYNAAVEDGLPIPGEIRKLVDRCVEAKTMVVAETGKVVEFGALEGPPSKWPTGPPTDGGASVLARLGLKRGEEQCDENN